MWHSPSDSRHIGVPGRAITMATLFVLVAIPLAAQTYDVIYNFSGCGDGYYPSGTLRMDGSGSLYGAAEFGGSACGVQGKGVVFRLKHAGTGWIETPLHTFTGGPNDGEGPIMYDGLVVGPDGAFYGTTGFGGHSGSGTVFRVRPPFRACTTAICPWLEDVLYSFGGSGDGFEPTAGVTFDAAGNIYGTTAFGGSNSGVVFKLTRTGGGWTESVIGDFGGILFAGVTLDSVGNVYGVDYEGGQGLGEVFQLMPSGSGWTTHVIHSFQGSEGQLPAGGLIFDAAGNLYGSTTVSRFGGGTIFELSPSGGSWTLRTLYQFDRAFGPETSLTMDADGNLYGTLPQSGTGHGTVFKLVRNGDNWTYLNLHDFAGGNDGDNPSAGVTVGSDGKLYGTTSAGGTNGAGVVWQITP